MVFNFPFSFLYLLFSIMVNHGFTQANPVGENNRYGAGRLAGVLELAPEKSG